MGRLLIVLLLYEAEVLHDPLLYLSLYFKMHRVRYYELLNKVRMTGDWEAWLGFFAEAVIATAREAFDTTQELLSVYHRDGATIRTLGRMAVSTLEVHRALAEQPIATSNGIVKKTGLTSATVNKALEHLERLAILREITGRKRNRVFSYTRYLEIINRGMALPEN